MKKVEQSGTSSDVVVNPTEEMGNIKKKKEEVQARVRGALEDIPSEGAPEEVKKTSFDGVIIPVKKYFNARGAFWPKTSLTWGVICSLTKGEVINSDLSKECEYIEGNEPGNGREVGYRAIYLSALSKMVLVSDQDSEATFVVYVDPTDEVGKDLEYYFTRTKEELRMLSNVREVIWNKYAEEWQERIRELLLASGRKIRTEKRKQIGGAQEPSWDKSEEMEPKERGEIGEGYMTATALARQLGVDQGTVKNIAEGLRKTHEKKRPEWFRVVVKQGKPFDYYHPDVVEKVEQEIGWLRERGPAPEGWMTSTPLGKELGKNYTKIRRVAEWYREDHPEWFGFFLDSTNQLNEFFAPELVEIIKKEVRSEEKAPEGWRTASSVARELDKNPDHIAARAEQYRESHPAFFRKYYAVGEWRDYYRTDLVAEIKRAIYAEIVPEGWLANKATADKLGAGENLVKSWVKELIEEDPRLAIQVHKKGKLRYYGPELVAKLAKKAEGREKAPRGWRTIRGVVEEVKKDTGRNRSAAIRTLAKKLKGINPGKFKKFIDERGREWEYMSPGIVEVIKKDLPRL